ncbi:MAG: four helix bundle protein [Elusimicrobiales bacterium]|nr:four helix bundle protein [Elusimicrobiales bacterium]
MESTEKIKNYKDLVVWQKGMELVKNIYQLTNEFPKKEIFGLTIQMRRASVSVPSNIAEGQARHYTREFMQFLYQALGSLSELETQIIIAKELNYISASKEFEIDNQIIELKKMICGLVRGLPAD